MGKKAKRKSGAKQPVRKSRKEIRKEQRKEKKLKRSVKNFRNGGHSDSVKTVEQTSSNNKSGKVSLKNCV